MEDYWTEQAEIAANEAGIKLTPEQIDIVAGVIESAHEYFGQMHGHDVASANLRADNERERERLEAKLQAEKEKVTCRACNGYGYETISYGSRSGQFECSKCNGEGRHK